MDATREVSRNKGNDWNLHGWRERGGGGGGGGRERERVAGRGGGRLEFYVLGTALIISSNVVTITREVSRNKGCRLEPSGMEIDRERERGEREMRERDR